jgi:hypothetical protein
MTYVSRCLTKSEIKPNDLPNTIHPLFEQKRWKHSDYLLSTPITQSGLSGNLTAKNPLIWKALQPSLRLTTRVVDSAEMWPWYMISSMVEEESLANVLQV